MEKRRIIEAALFMSSKPLPIEELAKLLGIAAVGYVEKEIRKHTEAVCISFKVFPSGKLMDGERSMVV